MAPAKWLLDLLVCPACHGSLELKAGGTGLVCLMCRRVYRIEDDIPIMLVSEAVIEDPSP